MTAAATTSNPRWAMSFADLCLVLLAFLLLLQANRGNPAAVGAGIRAAFGAQQAATPGVADRPVAPMFEGGEAVLLAPARAELQAIGKSAAVAGASVKVESLGSDGTTRRFDGWELSAARAAAVARAIAEGGLDADKVDLRVAGTRDAKPGERQHVRITTVKG
jgi:hypothetical protein